MAIIFACQQSLPLQLVGLQHKISLSTHTLLSLSISCSALNRLKTTNNMIGTSFLGHSNKYNKRESEIKFLYFDNLLIKFVENSTQRPCYTHAIINPFSPSSRPGKQLTNLTFFSKGLDLQLWGKIKWKANSRSNFIEGYIQEKKVVLIKMVQPNTSPPFNKCYYIQYKQ